MERDTIDRLKNGQLEFPPLTFRPVSLEPKGGNIDMIVEATWKDKKAIFAVECKASSTPRMLRDAAARAKAYAQRENLEPMIVVPFLGRERLDELEREGVSGVDLCGNGIVVAPGNFAVSRTGAPNRFRNSAPIKNIYQKNSSIVGRVFLAQPRYAAVREIQREIKRRNLPIWPPISLATVSKALKGLEGDLIVSRDNAGISLVQPDKLLEKLAANFVWKKGRASVRAKLTAEGDQLLKVLAKTANALNLPLVATGVASVSQYAVMQRGPVLAVYCTEPEALLERAGGTVTDRFPNIEIFEADEPFFYFDARTERDFRRASPLQVYLELMAGDKRDSETAEQVRTFILNNVGSQFK